MKKLRLLFIFGVLACTFMALVACNLPAFPSPTNVRVDDGAYTLLWNEVKGATRGYIVSINGDEVEASRARLDISNLPTEKEYTFKVKALGNKTTNSNSAWSEPITVYREYENGLSFKYINGNTEYELIGIGSYKEKDADGKLTVNVPESFRGKPVTSVANSAFYNNLTINKIVFPNTIKSIGENAFRNCSLLEEVELPASVEKIGVGTFQGCANLNKVTISGSLKVIPEKAFMNCSKLSALTIGEGVEEIGVSAFASCKALTTLNLPDSLKDINDYAFAECTKLATVKGSHIENIGNRAFYLCSEIADLTIGSSLKTIGDFSFAECRKITSVVIADTAEKIGQRAFLNCIELANVEIGDNLTYIGREAFNGTALWEAAENIVYIGTTVGDEYVEKWVVETKDLLHSTTLDIEDSVLGIAAYGCYMLPFRDEDESNIIHYSDLRRITIPDSVKYINDYAFRSSRYLTEVTIGNGLEIIGTAAFMNCANLVTVNIDRENSSLKSIKDYAFADCTKLGMLEGTTAYVKDLTFPEGLTEIGYLAFENTYFWSKPYMGVVYVGGWVVGAPEDEDDPNGVYTSIEVVARSPYSTGDEMYSIPTIGICNFAFYNKSSLEEIELPNTLIHMGIHAFHSCTSLTTAEIPSSITEIRDFAFYKCEALEKLTLPDTIKTIGKYAFYRVPVEEINLSSIVTLGEGAFASTPSLKKVNIGENLTSLGDRVFSGSTISSIVIPGKVTVIPENAFSNCLSLNSVLLSDSVTEIGRYAFNGCTNLPSIYIPKNVKSVGDYAFRKCESLINITISEGVESIGKGAFYGCKWLESIVLPTTLKLIDSQAFRGCDELKSVIIKDGSVETMGTHVFYGCTDLTIFTDIAEAPEGWDARWNTGYRPVFFGCTLSSENGFYYVESFVKNENTLVNWFLRNIISAPERVGYEFVCWETSDGTAQYKAADVFEAPNGTTLNAVWQSK